MEPSPTKRKVEFKRLTPKSLNEIDERIKIEKELEAQKPVENEEDEATAIYKAPTLKDRLSKIFPFLKKKKRRTLADKRPNKELLTGNTLPNKLKAIFPDELTGRPIEELDEFYRLQRVINI